MAATRFATSKLKELGDFQSLSTFGFRGEALASVSLVSRLSICSRIPENNIGYLQNYQDGKPILKKSKPQARGIGTTVSVKDLFYNLPHRQKSNEREEYQRVLSVVQAYAIHTASREVQFVCRHKQKVDLNTTTLVVQSNTDATTAATERVLKHVFGSQIQFTSLECKQQQQENACSYSCHGLVSTTRQKKSSLILFVNDRLVECPPLKRMVHEVMASPSILYISVEIPPTQVDVNVHPTKKQVTLLYQDEILSGIQTTLAELVKSQEQTFVSASVEASKKTAVVNPYKKKRKATENSEDTNRPKPTTTTTVAPSSKIRTTRAAPAGALEPYLVVSNGKSNNNEETRIIVPFI